MCEESHKFFEAITGNSKSLSVVAESNVKYINKNLLTFIIQFNNLLFYRAITCNSQLQLNTVEEVNSVYMQSELVCPGNIKNVGGELIRPDEDTSSTSLKNEY